MFNFKIFIHFFHLIRFSHTIFAFPFAISILLINKKEWPNYSTLFYLSLSLIFARAAAMAFNRLVDLSYDKKNNRTKKRVMVQNLLNQKQVIIFIILSSFIFIIASYQLNFLCFILSPIVLALLFFYSYWKRFSMFSHIYLGCVISLAPLGVDLAINNYLSLNSFLLFLGLSFWICGFDIIYSLLDINFDRNEKLHSIPAKIGIKKSLIISRISYILMTFFLICLGLTNKYSLIYYIGLISIIILLIFQHILLKENDLSKINLVFFNLNSLISILYLLIIILELYL